MKKLTCILFLITILQSCAVYRGYYDVGLQNVERPENVQERYGESQIAHFDEDGETKYRYEDEILEIIWIPTSSSFSFVLQNKTDHSIKIIWDEAVYVNEDGLSMRVMHSGVKYIDRNNPQPPTTVVRNAKIEDLIMPTENVYYASGKYGGWRTNPLFPRSAMSQEELNSLTSRYIGKEVQILLPLEIQGHVNEYLFSFRINGFEKM